MLQLSRTLLEDVQLQSKISGMTNIVHPEWIHRKPMVTVERDGDVLRVYVNVKYFVSRLKKETYVETK